MHTSHDLAYANPLRIAVQTGFPIRSVTDWIDMALWSVYVGVKIRELSRMGLRTALEAYHFRNEHCLTPTGEPKRGAEKDPKVVELAKTLGINPAFVPELLEQVAEDPHLAFVSKMWGETDGDESNGEDPE